VGDEESGTLGIGELAMRVGVTPRTVRYYVAEGLLPPPGGGGQQRTYTQEHLLRLQAIKRLKDAYLPLGEIRRQLDGLSRAELEELAESEPPARPSSALEYINSILPPARRASPPAAPVLSVQLGTGQPAEAGEAGAGTVWRRVSLAPGVELHYEPSGDGQRQREIDRLIEEARRLLSNPRPPGREPQP
jgi:DNA-binding transcriptional MerR regulator